MRHWLSNLLTVTEPGFDSEESGLSPHARLCVLVPFSKQRKGLGSRGRQPWAQLLTLLLTSLIALRKYLLFLSLSFLLSEMGLT